MVKPTITSTAASPRLKAVIKNNPKPMRCKEKALSNTTSAAGQGTIPPVIPSMQSSRNDSGRSTVFGETLGADFLNIERSQCEWLSPGAWECAPLSPVQCLRKMKMPSAATLKPDIAPSQG